MPGETNDCGGKGACFVKTWTRARQLTICGGCGHHIQAHDPVLEITFVPQRAINTPLEGAERPSTWLQTRLRCATCAGEPVPADLPARRERTSTIAPMPKPKRIPVFASVGALAADWKHKQAGDREPGADG